jgi:hypothetical protein
MTESDAGFIALIISLSLILSSCMVTGAIVNDKWEKEAIANKVGTYNSDGKFEWVKP